MNEKDLKQIEGMLSVGKPEADHAREVIARYDTAADKYLADVARVVMRDPAGPEHISESALLTLGELRGILRPLYVALKTVDLFEEGQRQLKEARSKVYEAADRE